ncbi:MAG: NUDIX domain-containing protein [Chlorobium limicola]|jgi:8-oxo-dGTP diphosphatase|nr:NUDIX domain-containing protein [Chlorobium limicola]
MKRSGASIIFINSRSEVLLLLRDDKPGIPYPNMWDLPGGHVEASETPEACIVREMQEEIETDVSSCRLYAVCDFPDRIEHIFLMDLDAAAEEITLHEGQALRWFSVHELVGLPLAYGFDLVLSDFFAALRQNQITTRPKT